jgi:flavin-dependent dehydrogenase
VSGGPPEVLVLGGGPAGCAAARLLALWDHHVVLVTKPASPLTSLPESIPPSAGKLFDVLGVREAMDEAGFIRSTGNTVWWGSTDARHETFANGARGWQVTASRLEPILQRAAAAGGAHIEHGRLTAEQAAGRGATFVLDCTGRTGVISRARGWRVFEAAHRTVALVGEWRAPAPFDVRDPSHTVIESYHNGWAWSVPTAADRRCIALMVDPRTSDLAHDRTAREVYRAEIAKTAALAHLVRNATLTEGPVGWDASMYSATRYAQDDVLLVGDAGSFIDPLSSIGVKKALASGWLAAVATHTALIRPAMRQIALDFFSAREAEIYTTFRSMTSQYLAEAATAHAHPFWGDRSQGDVETMADEAASISAAYDRIRTAQSISLKPARSLRVEDRPSVSGAEIVMEPRIVSDTRPAGVRYVSDVDILTLIDMAPAFRQVPDLFEAYSRLHAPVALPDFLTALSTLVANEWLVFDDEPVTTE